MKQDKDLIGKLKGTIVQEKELAETEKKIARTNIVTLEQDVAYLKRTVGDRESQISDQLNKNKQARVRHSELEEEIEGHVRDLQRKDEEILAKGREVDRSIDKATKYKKISEKAEVRASEAKERKLRAERLAATYEATVRQLQAQLKAERE